MVFAGIAVNAQYNNAIQIEQVLKTDTTTIGQKISYPHSAQAEVIIKKITLKPGQSTGWHKHEIPVFAYVQKGTLTIELENKAVMQFPENSSFAEVLNTFHNGENRGDKEVVLIAFFMSEKGKSLSIPK
jgi:quercetin dioxygenase-like cupin family protein